MRNRGLLPGQFTSASWTRADTQLAVAAFCVVLFTAQRLTGYMGLWLYKNLAYENLVLAAHVLGGAGLVVALTLGAREVAMQSRDPAVARGRESWVERRRVSRRAAVVDVLAGFAARDG